VKIHGSRVSGGYSTEETIAITYFCCIWIYAMSTISRSRWVEAVIILQPDHLSEPTFKSKIDKDGATSTA
jgi:hypothetical protein